MSGLLDLFSTADSLLALPAEDLGVVLLRIVQEERGPRVTISSIEMPVWNANSSGFPHHRRSEVARAIGEAWQWLQNTGLLMTDPEQPNGYFCLTRKGRAIKSPADFEAYRQGNVLPVALLHPTIAEKARPMFMRGDYDVAVFQAFKDVELAVRTAAKLSDSDIGRKLMQIAFQPEKGPLTDSSADKGEQVGVMDLFSGAIGYCKNPASHRSPGYDRVAAAQLLAFASFLLTQVDQIT
jgi:uncharacterized protein (TIGR02391 family)